MIKCVFDGYELCGTHRLLQDLGIQAQFIAEVIIDSSDIRSCSCADFANRRSLIAAVGKNWPRSLQQFLACRVWGRSPTFALAIFSPSCERLLFIFKRKFESTACSILCPIAQYVSRSD